MKIPDTVHRSLYLTVAKLSDPKVFYVLLSPSKVLILGWFVSCNMFRRPEIERIEVHTEQVDGLGVRLYLRSVDKEDRIGMVDYLMAGKKPPTKQVVVVVVMMSRVLLRGGGGGGCRILNTNHHVPNVEEKKKEGNRGAERERVNISKRKRGIHFERGAHHSFTTY